MQDENNIGNLNLFSESLYRDQVNVLAGKTVLIHFNMSHLYKLGSSLIYFSICTCDVNISLHIHYSIPIH